MLTLNNKKPKISFSLLRKQRKRRENLAFYNSPLQMPNHYKNPSSHIFPPNFLSNQKAPICNFWKTKTPKKSKSSVCKSDPEDKKLRKWKDKTFVVEENKEIRRTHRFQRGCALDFSPRKQPSLTLQMQPLCLREVISSAKGKALVFLKENTHSFLNSELTKY